MLFKKKEHNKPKQKAPRRTKKKLATRQDKQDIFRTRSTEQNEQKRKEAQSNHIRSSRSGLRFEKQMTDSTYYRTDIGCTAYVVG